MADPEIDAFDAWLKKHNLPRPPSWSGVGQGWFSILDTMVAKLKTAGWTGEFLQIKEKFGGLRVYATGLGDYRTSPIYAVVREAQDASYGTCEKCGQPGVERSSKHGWIHVSCGACALPDDVMLPPEDPEGVEAAAAPAPPPGVSNVLDDKDG